MIDMKRKTAVLVTEDDLLMDLAFHNVAPSLLIDFSEKIVRPCYGGNLTAAISDLFGKALCEQDFVKSHIVQELKNEAPQIIQYRNAGNRNR
jgi:hypothetical protein